MEYLFIYLLQVTVFLHNISIWLMVLAPIVLLAICIAADENNTKLTDDFFIAPLIILIIGLLLHLLPTKQTLLLMGGTYLGKKAVNAVVTDEKIKKVDTIINLQLDKYIKELQK